MVSKKENFDFLVFFALCSFVSSFELVLTPSTCIGRLDTGTVIKLWQSLMRKGMFSFINWIKKP